MKTNIKIYDLINDFNDIFYFDDYINSQYKNKEYDYIEYVFLEILKKYK